MRARATKTLQLNIPPYGTPGVPSRQDLEWLKGLYDSLWAHTAERRVIRTRKITQVELDRVVTMIRNHVLPCAMGSGPYGDLSVNVYENLEVPDVRPILLFGMHEDHLGWGGTWDMRFDELSKLTHTPENEKLCNFYRLPAPGPRERYTY